MIKDEYNKLFVHLIFSIAMYVRQLPEEEIALVNSELHSFDRDMRKLLENVN